MRGELGIAFTEVPALWDADSLCSLRPWLTSPEATFFVTDETHKVELWPRGHKSKGPGYTKKLETALVRDLPEARVVLNIPRPNGPNWLNVYRVDQPGAGQRFPRVPNAACGG